MKIFIQALDYNMWSIIINGPHNPTHTVNNIITLKSKLEWDENEESSEEDKSKLEVAFLARKIRNLMRKKRIVPRRRIIDREEIKKEKKKKI